MLETTILIFYGWVGAKGKSLAAQSDTFALWQDRVAGSVLVLLGINLLFISKRL